MPEEKPKQPEPAPPEDKKPAEAPAAQNKPPAAPADTAEGSLETPEQPAADPAAPFTAPPDEAPPKKPGLLSRRTITDNMFLIVFVLLVLAGAAVIYISLNTAKPKNSVTKSASLTSDQLSAIKGNTTLVGDAKQTIDIQSNSIFEGSVLARSDLNIAGALKVGGNLSLPSIDVGNSGTFGQLGVNGGLNVKGDTSLQGQLTVQKNLSVVGSASFGALNVSTLDVTTLNLRGDLNVNQHIIASGGTPSRSNGTALGSGGSAGVSGSDTAGTVSVNTGGSPPAGCFVTVNFAHKFSSTPHVVISPANSSAATIQYYTNQSSSGFSVCTANAPAAGTSYVYNYLVID